MTAGGDNNGFLTFYDADSGKLLHQDGQNAHIHEISAGPDFQQIFVAAHEKLTRWTMLTEKPVAETQDGVDSGAKPTAPDGE